MKQQHAIQRIILLLWSGLLCWGCDKVIETDASGQVPDAVVQAVAERFSGVSSLSISTLQAGAFYVADFYAQTRHYLAVVAQDGSIRSLEAEQSVDQVSANALDYVANQLPTSVIERVYEQSDPANGALLGYCLHVRDSGQTYLLTFDALGARVSTMPVPASGWLRYRVGGMSDVPLNIRSVIEAAHTPVYFQDACMFVDTNRNTSWQVAVRNSNFLYHYRLDTLANILDYKSEDLLALSGTGMTFLDIDAASMPTVMSDFLDARFTGWEFQRCIFLLNNNAPAGFTVIIQLNQVVYYTRFGISGNFIGATKA
jgi:hypothetical protein